MTDTNILDELAHLEAQIRTLCSLQYRQFKILHGLINGQLEQRRENRQLHSATRHVVFDAFADDKIHSGTLRRIEQQVFGGNEFFDEADLARFERECALGGNSGN